MTLLSYTDVSDSAYLSSTSGMGRYLLQETTSPPGRRGWPSAQTPAWILHGRSQVLQLLIILSLVLWTYVMWASLRVLFVSKHLWRNWLARSAVNRKVAGSSPARCDYFFQKLGGITWLLPWTVFHLLSYLMYPAHKTFAPTKVLYCQIFLSPLGMVLMRLLRQQIRLVRKGRKRNGG